MAPPGPSWCLLPYLAAFLICLACSPAPTTIEAPSATDLAGVWRGVLESPGGELPFALEVVQRSEGLAAVVSNGEERAPVSSVTMAGRSVRFAFAGYDAVLEAELDGAGATMSGTWSKLKPEGYSRLPFRAAKGQAHRFGPDPEPEGSETPPVDFSGIWAVTFRDSDGEDPARGEFRQDGNRVLGTFLTPTGDYRYLDGRADGPRLRLSTFDGAHAFLFDARLGEDGTLAGDFWSRDSYHATWIARRIPSEETVLPDAWSLVGLTNDEGRFRFSFPDLEGQPLSLEDPRFAGKVVLVNLFGTWCPNCNDKAPLLGEWYRGYRDRGLEIVGLAYEYTGDSVRDGRQVRRFAERHGIDYPLLLAGLSDKAQAAATLADLDRVVAFPTTVFIGRDGRVRRIHSGFSGPGTGEHYLRLKAELEATIEELLAESAPA